MKKFIYTIIIVGLCSCSEQPEKSCVDSVQAESFSEGHGTESENLSRYEMAYNKALDLWGCDFKEMKIPTAFGNAQVIEAGSKNKEVIVLLHGMNASSTMWYPNVKALSEKYKVYAIDFLMEPGKSEQKVEIESTAQIVRWYTEIFDSLNLDKFSIVGASRGGWLGVNLAMRHPDRVENLVLLSPAQTFKWIPIGKDMFSNLVYTFKPKRKKLRKSLKSMSSNVDNIEQDYIDHYFLSTKRATVSKIFVEMTPFKDSELNSLKMPVLVLIGDNDFINNEKSILKAKRCIPNVQAEIVKKAGHFLSFDQSNFINERIIRFIE